MSCVILYTFKSKKKKKKIELNGEMYISLFHVKES